MISNSKHINFGLIGASGYIAPRHMKAIKDNGGDLLAAYDPYDGIGVMDSYFPKAAFFTEFERFDRHVDKLKRSGSGLDFISICSPNYLHDSHIRFGLKNNANVICEKPLTLNPWNINTLVELEKEFGFNVYTILQLRLHPAIIDLRNKVLAGPSDKVYDLDLAYITSRGNWYYSSWKGDISKSGGIATNIGVHFFDMLSWVFGSVKTNIVHVHTHDRAAGFLELERARVRWFLSINEETLPTTVKKKGQRTFRSFTIEGQEVEFSDGFTDLHTHSYKNILDGNGFRAVEALPSIEIVHQIRNAEKVGLVGDYHPFAKLPITNHPFKS
jgi:UDP-N-acetyl-2-amino-2-deoxyglucuronate dehydrogenase